MQPRIPIDKWQLLKEGTVIPAHPLALTKEKKLDVPRQRALTHYYMDSGAGGIAVGVHTTQFEIRDPHINLFKTVLKMASEEVHHKNLDRPFLKIAGICGPTSQAVKEAEVAYDLGYDLGLVSMGGVEISEEEHVNRIKEIARVIPVFGFYLQPAVGGRTFSYDFWRAFSEIDGVYAIKLAPFNRYQTLDVVRAVCHSSRKDDISLYTGNDDNILIDLMTTYECVVDQEMVRKSIVGGLLGHWAVWTSKAVELLTEVKTVREQPHYSKELLTRAASITDCNAAVFDAANQYKGCIAGINEVLRRQGLLNTNVCLNEHERLSPGQAEEIDRIYAQYPHLTDDTFVKANVQKWITQETSTS